MKKTHQLTKLFFVIACSFLYINSSANNEIGSPPTLPPSSSIAKNDVDFWLTKGDQTALLQKQTAILAFGKKTNTYQNIEVDETQTYQTDDGFGFTLTGGSAQVINQLTAQKKA